MPAAAGPAMPPPERGVTVRMYRPRGLGDCFLLAFRADDGSPRYLLIDCGVFFGTAGGAARMRAIAEDVERATGGRLHAVVGTHEHYDHLSGFEHAEEVFERLEIDAVWLAWTEDPAHPVAQRLRRQRAMALTALAAAAARLRLAGSEMAGPLGEVLGFSGVDPALGISGTAGQMDYLRRRAGTPRICRPGGEPLALPGVAGVRIYVLGPPEDETLLTRSNPSKVDSEVYESAFALGEEAAFYQLFLAAGEGGEPGELDRFELSCPFDRRHHIPFGEAAQHPEHGAFFRRSYGPATPGEDDDAPAWRRIDDDWLGPAAQLALKLDNDTNNTSLALAIELAASGRVLLFPGDAQVGNWLSWHRLRWTDERGGEVTAADLLRRTVLYKVGHHGSHNATLREKGLEMMASPELTAMIPVDAEQAGKKKWAMPFAPLDERLKEKCRGRILRADTGVPEKPPGVSEAEWTEFTGRVRVDPGPDELWLELDVPG